MRIAILGGGNGSLAAAADFTEAGHDTRLWRRDQAEVTKHNALDGHIAIRDAKGNRTVQVPMITNDLAQAMDQAELVFCPVPAHAHADLALRIAPHLMPGQVVFLPPGTLGSILFDNAAKAVGTAEGVAFAETGTLPWLVRKHDFAEIVISTRAVRLPVGVFPQNRSDVVCKIIECAFPGVIEPCGDVLSGALMNAGPIIHPPLIIMNAGPLEHFEQWDIHNEGTQPAIRRVTDQLDAERIAVREAFGYGAPHFPLVDHYRDDGDMWMYDRASRANLVSSGDWREDIVLTEHRYMLEDLRLGLSLLWSLAVLAKVDAPIARGLLALGSAICKEDFLATGRTLQSLGLGRLSKSDLRSYLETGF